MSARPHPESWCTCKACLAWEDENLAAWIESHDNDPVPEFKVIPHIEGFLDIGEDGILSHPPFREEPLHPHPFETDYYDRPEGMRYE